MSKNGYASLAIDLPGAGKRAKFPHSFSAEPFDLAAFSTEPSPNNGPTQSERTEAVISAIREAKALGHGSVVLVGHSLGGLTLNQVGELIPGELHSIVYLTAFMLPNGKLNRDFVLRDGSIHSGPTTLFMANPAEIGAQRLNVRSNDLQYAARIKEIFYGDVPDQEIELFRRHLHPDEPFEVTTHPSPITRENFGRIQRHFIRCTADNAITIDMQDAMITQVDAQLGNKTHVHTLYASHSPFLSMPEALAKVLIKTAA